MFPRNRLPPCEKSQPESHSSSIRVLLKRVAPSFISNGVPSSFDSRTDVGRELQRHGVEPAAARQRVAAMSDGEVRALSDRITAPPAGADVAGILLLVVVVALIWWLWKR